MVTIYFHLMYFHSCVRKIDLNLRLFINEFKRLNLLLLIGEFWLCVSDMGSNSTLFSTSGVCVIWVLIKRQVAVIEGCYLNPLLLKFVSIVFLF